MQWIKIYDAGDEIDMSMVKGLLESHEIKVQIVPRSAGSVFKAPEFLTNYNIPYEIFVPEDQKEKAEKILESKEL